MNALVQLAVLGIATGVLYALSALGVVVVYRSSGVLNLANGAFAMMAGYAMFSLHDSAGWPPAVAAVVAVGVSCLLALLIYFAVMRPLNSASTLSRLVATLAVYLVAQSVIQLIFGPFTKVPTAFLPTAAISIGGISIGWDAVITIMIAIAITAALTLVYRYSRFGMATTAVAENPRALAALGHDVGRLRAMNWLVAGLLGGVSGVLIAPITQLTPAGFLPFLVPSLAAAVLGGMRSFPITMVAGMCIGAAEVLCARYVHIAGVRDALPFVVIIAVLMLRGKSLPGRDFVSEHLPRVGSGQLRVVPICVAVAAVAVLAYTVFDDSLVLGSTVLGAVALIALSQVVITGYAGQLSLAQMSMAGVGALCAAQVSVAWGVPFLLAIVISAVVVIPVGVVVALPALRARGTTLAIVTLGFGVAVSGMILNNNDVNGGVAGLSVPSPTAFGIDLNPILYPRNYLVVVLVALVALCVLVANLRRGRSGRRLLAVRSNERAAAALGINVVAAKLYAFTVAGVIAAVGGVLLAFRNPAVVVSGGFDVFASISTLAYTVLGGVGYVLGAIVGAGFNTSALPAVAIGNVMGNLDIDNLLNTWFPLIGGLLLLAQLIFQPAGIVDAIVHPPRRARSAHPADSLSIPPTAPSAANSLPRPSLVGRLLGTRASREAALQAEIAQALAVASGATTPRRGDTLTVRDATVRYGSVTAVDAVSFEVAPGEVLSVIGPNGAGKTSLMDGITGFAPMRGTVDLGDRRIESWPAYRRARAGLVRSFQTLELLEDMTVLDNLRVAQDRQDLRSYLIDLIHPIRGQLSMATTEVIAAFQLGPLLSKVPTELAYGDRRLVAIARAVAGAPSVLLLDEPAAGLSETERTKVGDLIRMIATQWQIPVVLIEHDVALVRRVSDRVVAVDFGVPITTGTPEEVLADPRVVEAYLGHAEATSTDTRTAGARTAPGDDARAELAVQGRE